MSPAWLQEVVGPPLRPLPRLARRPALGLPVVAPITPGDGDATIYALQLECRGCGRPHSVRVREWTFAGVDVVPHETWHTAPGVFTWNGSLSTPTITGLVVLHQPRFVHPHLGTVIEPGWHCAFTLAHGVLRYTAECTHAWASQAVTLRPQLRYDQ